MIPKLIEGKYYLIHDLQSQIGLGYLTLVRAGIIIEKELRAKLNFVGLLFGESNFCFVLPKYYRKFKESELQDYEISLIQDSLITYGRTTSLYTPSLFDEEGVICSPKLQAANKIIEYYFKKGLLAPNREVQTSSYDDKVNWGKTVELATPLIINNKPLYFNPISVKSTKNEYHQITEIQKWLTQKSFELVGSMMFPSQSINLTSNCFEDDKGYYINIIEGYLQNIYTDDEIALLQNMLVFLFKEIEVESSDIEVFGTRSFYRIWELANKVLWKDQFEALKTYIPFPIWEFNRENYLSKDTIIPDILLKTETRFYIIDAKYYLPTFIRNKPKGQPNIESLTKQFLYEEILKEKFPNLEFVNIFCFPDEKHIDNNSPINVITSELINGSVNFTESPYNSIINVYIPPNSLLKNYVENLGARLEI
ncbi:LlaJI family restriction endonuclease [Maribacter aquivivus]|uniref:LlaJI family restriction endonuclease n=1 Tax=Maribacter aquivivus TaxID=228958 RepID=UPI0024911D39|nr:LlaJI family restriction endonuclease [Maribacter aquivivus]